MKGIKKIRLGDDILKENEISANRLICKGMMFIGAISLVYLGILIFMWDKWNGQISYAVHFKCVIGGILLILINCCFGRSINYDTRRLKYFLMFSMIVILSTISILGVYGLTLGFAVPIVLSCRYYSEKFTWFTIIATFIALVISRVLSVLFGIYEGYIDINMMIIPRGSTVTFGNSVSKTILECYEVDVLSYLGEGKGYMLINLGLFVIISFAALNFVKYGRRMTEDSKKLETEILISQIQPHFIFNTLATIGELCKSDPETAGEVTTNFTNYLRLNMNVVKDVRFISFAKEMEYVNYYVEIEKIRFEGMISLECNLEYMDFKIPPVIVQPMVENAIKHGIRPKDCPGTIRIASRLVDRWAEITVEDDGIGFDAAKAFSSERKHIGIHNVSARLERICGGVLTVESEPGAGTKVTIRVPADIE